MTGLPADEWVGTDVWGRLQPPFAASGAAWAAVREVAAAAGDFVITGIMCQPVARFGPLVLRCTWALPRHPSAPLPPPAPSAPPTRIPAPPHLFLYTPLPPRYPPFPS